MEGKLVAEQVFDFANFQPTVSHPCGLDSGNPCRNDGFSTLVYNDENSGLRTLILQAPAWPFFGKLELQNPHSQAGAWERATIQVHSNRLSLLMTVGNKKLAAKRVVLSFGANFSSDL